MSNYLKISHIFSFHGVRLDLVLGEEEGLVKRKEGGIGIPERRSWKNCRNHRLQFVGNKIRTLPWVKQFT